MEGLTPSPSPAPPRSPAGRGWRALLLGLALLAGPRALAAQAEAGLRVLVVDSATREPLPRARVTVVDGPRGGTDDGGELWLVARVAGAWVVEVEHLGYAARRVMVRTTADEATELTVALAPVPLRLGGLQARAASRGLGSVALRSFYTRAGAGGGQYFTRADIDRIRPREVSDLFRVVPGMVVVPTPDGERPRLEGGGGSSTRVEGFVRSPVGTGRDNTTCPILYFLDGTPIDPPNGLIDAEIEPAEVEGIEIYRRGSLAPPQFRRNHNCGVVLIWKRQRIDRA